MESRLPDRLVAAIADWNPELVAISGDLTQRGRSSEYECARALLSRIRAPYLVVPGNHDVQGLWLLWERFLWPFANYKRYITSDLEPEWQNDSMRVIGTNSAKPIGWHLDWSRGRLSRRQMRRVVERGQAAEDQLTHVLVVHHPPASPPGGTARHLIGRLSEFTRMVDAAGIDLVLAGHFHQSYCQTLPLRQRACVISCVSTATSHRLKGEPNGFHTIEGDSHGITIQDRAWDGSSYALRRSWQFQRGAGRDWSQTGTA